MVDDLTVAPLAELAGTSSPLDLIDASPDGADGDEPSIDYLITLWLEAKQGRTGSERTRQEYAVTMGEYRATLQAVGLDLDCGDHRKLADVALIWAKRPKRRGGAEPSSATRARRFAILSSFFTFAIRHQMVEWRRDRKTKERFRSEMDANPMRLIERPHVQRYAAAVPLDAQDLEARLRAIDRATLEGKRDFALITIDATTGRRRSELANLRMRDIAMTRSGAVTLTFTVKGGDVVRNKLARVPAEALKDWLAALYPGVALSTLADGAPVWVALSRDARWRLSQEHGGALQPLSKYALGGIWDRRLGTSKVHALRHTLAQVANQLGASLTEIQTMLHHKKSSTTAEYLHTMGSIENPYAEKIAAMFGLE